MASNDTGVTHFLIDQETNHDPSVFKFVYNVTNPNVTSVTLNLPGWATLRFRVRAVNSFGPSRPSLPTAEGICTTSVGSTLLVDIDNGTHTCYTKTDIEHKDVYESFPKSLRRSSECFRTFFGHFERLSKISDNQSMY